MNTSNVHLLELLQDQFCFNDLDGASEQSVLIMTASFAHYSESHLPTTIDTSIGSPTHTVRIVLRTTDEDHTCVCHYNNLEFYTIRLKQQMRYIS